MKKGQRVSWLVKGKVLRGKGTVLTDEEDGLVLVSVDTFAGESNPGYHSVISCTTTWLTVMTQEEDEDAQLGATVRIADSAMLKVSNE